MNTIGFDNFRRFASFPEMDLGQITLLVGGNNSGKSTLVKALLLCVDNAKQMVASTKDNIFASMMPKFRFDANEWHDVKIKTFSRAIHNKPTRSFDLLDDTISLPSEMRFTFTIGDFRFVIEIIGDRESDEATGQISYISIEDRGNMLKYDVSFKGHSMDFFVLGSTTERETLVQRLYKDYVSAKEALNSLSESGDDIAAISAQSEKVTLLEKQIEEFVNPDGNELPEDFDYEDALYKQYGQFVKTRYASTSWELPFVDYGDTLNENLLVHIIKNFIAFAKNPGMAQPSGITDPNEYGAAMQSWMYVENARSEMKQLTEKMEESCFDLEQLLYFFKFEYISAHAANQNTIYNTADRNDYIAQTVHEFIRSKILSGEKEHQFITSWMKKFGIGESYNVISLDGEAYRVIITDKDGSTTPLADKGMGSIQLMILLFKLATIIRTYGLSNISDDYPEIMLPTIIIEEPEQNLHPKIQSMLADLFYSLNQDYHCKFIVETHSEYLIRKTQVLVANENYEDEDAIKENNPFIIYYFNGENEKEPYYPMRYNVTGAFKEKFGTGFFDAATESEMVIIRKEFEQKKKNRK